MKKLIVAIVGRQNVGKSTLLNRLSGRRVAIVEDFPGTTRDRVFADAVWQDKEFTVVDTGGLEISEESEIGRGVRRQVDAAVREADLILFVTDVKDGVMPADFDIANLLRRTLKPVILVVNKVDNDSLEAQVPEFYELGLNEPISISAHHALGTGELLDKIVSMLPEQPVAVTEPESIKVAIIGRPNVGKSMLLNAIVGQERSIVSEVPGTTRDSVDTLFEFKGRNVLLIDTAGIRRRGSVEAGIERYSVLRSLRAIDRCDVVLMVLDASELVTSQDTHVAGYVQQAYKGIVIVVNKWDLIKEKNTDTFVSELKNNLKFLTYAPVMFLSALTKQGVKDVMPMVEQIYSERLKRLTDAEVRNIIEQAIAAHAPPRKGRKELVIKKGSQTEVNPPTFTFKVNDERLIHFSYRRYLENQIRNAYGFIGTPIKLRFTSGAEK
jgi:GTP-binding protein